MVVLDVDVIGGDGGGGVQKETFSKFYISRGWHLCKMHHEYDTNNPI